MAAIGPALCQGSFFGKNTCVHMYLLPSTSAHKKPSAPGHPLGHTNGEKHDH